MDTHLATLKALTIKKEANFSEAVHYFLDNLANDQTFLQQGKQTQRHLAFYKQLLTPVLKKCVASLTRKHFFLLHHKKYRFIQGGGALSTGAQLFFYFFEENQVGIATITDLTGRVNFFRLTAFISEKPIALHQTVCPTSNEIH